MRWGIVPSGHPAWDDTSPWPENAETCRVFDRLATQWRVGFGGAVGLDYGAIPVVLGLLGIPADRHSRVFEGLRIMEHETLSVWSEQKRK